VTERERERESEQGIVCERERERVSDMKDGDNREVRRGRKGAM
jgi:hypothetical protein